jgi:DNA-binding NarL/FixJ family response regulator
VLLDIHLGDKSGIDLLMHIKKEYPFIKVMMVSNKASQYYRDLCAEYGADYFIDKSKEFDQIAPIIKSLFADL